MYIVVKRCADTLKWYADKIGLTFYAHRKDDAGYWVRDNQNYWNVIDEADADEIINRNAP